MHHSAPAGNAPFLVRRILGCSSLLLAVAVAALLLSRDEPEPGTLDAPTRQLAAVASAESPVASDATSMVPELTRRNAVVPTTGTAARTFDQFVAALVELGLETSRLADAGQEDEAIERDREARELFAAMLKSIADADAMALGALSTPPPVDDHGTSSDSPSPIALPVPAWLLRENVLMMTLTVGLQRRHALVDNGRSGSEALTGGVLATLQARADLAERLGDELLVDKPYLSEAHEPQVLDLVAQSGAGTFPAAVATALLSTLWHNLQASGARTSDHLAGLALLLLDDGNRSEQLAAARLLLLDERYRDVVLEHLRQTKDADLARTLAMAAAQELPPTAAFAVLTTCAEVTGGDTAPFLTLATREPELLRREYEQRLGDDVNPRLRALLVTGAGFTNTPEGIELARLAFASDPDPEVRMRALFVLTGTAAEALGEAAIAQALDDPKLGGNPERLGAIVLALENLARAGMVNAVHRIGTRLLATAGMSPSTRAALDRMLAETLPGGLATTPAWR